jgi:purine-cytosine permease-like protein
MMLHGVFLWVVVLGTVAQRVRGFSPPPLGLGCERSFLASIIDQLLHTQPQNRATLTATC